MPRVAWIVIFALMFLGLHGKNPASETAFSRIARVNSHYVQYQDNERFYEIDMKLPGGLSKRRIPRAATSEQPRLWPNGEIPYVIAQSIKRHPEVAKLLAGAIAEWERKTCLRFRKRTAQRNYVEFYYGEGCNSDVGTMSVNGRQTTSLGKGCEDHGIMVHEIGHLIGLYHEQNRPDRDKYVKILWDNIFPKYFYAFEKKDPEDINSRNVPYDHYSVMHYGSKDFSKNRRPTIESKVDGITEFGNNKISPLDAKVVNLMYSCPELIKFPRDFYWKHYGLTRRDTNCIRMNEPRDPYSWDNNYLCRIRGRRLIGLMWTHQGPIDGMACVKAEVPSKQGRNSWDNNYFCWPSDSVYKFSWKTSKPPRSERHHCIKINEPRDRYWSRRNYYLCGVKDESPVDGRWSDWSEWSRCSRQCGGGIHRRVRACNNPAPAYGGRYCEGLTYETGTCGMKSCNAWPVFPDDFVYKEFALPPDAMLCLRTYERFDYFTWGNYLFCSPDDMKDPLFDWSDSGPLANKKCTRIFNAVEVRYRRNTWNNNYLCAPQDSPYSLKWSRNGPIKGMACLRWRPKNGKDGWGNSYLCNTKASPTLAGGKDDITNNFRKVHGGWTTWTSWSTCTRTCAGGFQKRDRKCAKPAPKNGGRPCDGLGVEKRRCNIQRCLVDGRWTYWSSWGSCTKPCGGGEQRRKRTCTNPAPQNGGNQCSGNDGQRKRCNDQRCPTHGGWSTWAWWGRCSKTCAGGVQVRSRSCTNPSPRDGGRVCLGKHGETRTCNTRACPIDGQWASWSSWRACSKSCSGGIQLRTRSCTNPAPRNGGRSCYDRNKQERRCNTTPCPINGAWTRWSAWRACSKSCGGGIQKRVRTCTNPIPRYGGSTCFGELRESRRCGKKACPLPPVHGKWSSWSPWKPCTKTCAGGVQQRIRTCTNPTPKYGGRGCYGRSRLESRCNTVACPSPAVHGKWSPWAPWRACSKSCGGGVQRRTHTCTNPRPLNGGRNCYGRNYQGRICNTQFCITRVDGKWTLWSPWKACSKTCGGGIQRRTRSCTNPRPSNGGRNCNGRTYENRSCNRQACRVRIDGKWTTWSLWTACSKSCGGGIQRRTRSCTNPRPSNGGRNCYGRTYENRNCNRQACRVRIDGKWTTWSLWTACSKSCGGGIQRRTRSCTNPRPSNGGRNCYGRTYENRNCNRQACRVRIDGKWTTWSLWTACSKTCGGGIQRRTRSCTNPRPSNGGRNCYGQNYENRSCNRQACRVRIDGKWTTWSLWTACSKTCGGGIQRRTRSCTNPRPSNGGRNCYGRTYENRNCNRQACRVRIDGKWTTWSLWTACSKTCGGGIQRRTRSCTNPRPSNGGRNCYGQNYENRSCNIQACTIRIDGNWSSWTPWRACSRTCGGGIQRRTRRCTNPRPSNGGRGCYGRNYDYRLCNRQSCRVDGKWTYWSSWKACSKTCGGGIQRRTRSCTNPRPFNGGRNCYGRTYENRSCNRQACSARVDGNWSLWSSWRTCSKSCGGGIQRRTRSCTNPRPSNGGRNCYGRNYENRSCNRQACRVRIVCGGNVSGYLGRLSSPRYPRNYPNNADCTWIINAPAEHRIKVTFRSFSMEVGGQSCSRDYLELRDGKTESSTVIGRFCGSSPARSVISSGKNMWVKFHSNTRNTYRGFHASWTADDGLAHTNAQKPTKVIGSCGGTISKNYGILSSPGFPLSYPRNANCEWIIKADFGRKIQFWFGGFDLDDRGWCRYDYVALRDGSTKQSRSLGRYCGARPPGPFRTSSNSFQIRLRTDNEVERPGFRLMWRSYKQAYKRSAVQSREKFKADCQSGWITSKGTNGTFCYFVTESYQTWTRAQSDCSQHNAELLTISSREEQEYIRSLVLKDSYIWLGFSDMKFEGNWRWDNTYFSTPLSYTNWATGEPNNGGRRGRENCAVMRPTGLWNDFPCSFKFRYICKKQKA